LGFFLPIGLEIGSGAIIAGLVAASCAENRGNKERWCDWHGSQLAGGSPAIAFLERKM
jgi:hypothetical protein